MFHDPFVSDQRFASFQNFLSRIRCNAMLFNLAACVCVCVVLAFLFYARWQDSFQEIPRKIAQKIRDSNDARRCFQDGPCVSHLPET